MMPRFAQLSWIDFRRLATFTSSGGWKRSGGRLGMMWRIVATVRPGADFQAALVRIPAKAFARSLVDEVEVDVEERRAAAPASTTAIPRMLFVEGLGPRVSSKTYWGARSQ